MGLGSPRLCIEKNLPIPAIITGKEENNGEETQNKGRCGLGASGLSMTLF